MTGAQLTRISSASMGGDADRLQLQVPERVTAGGGPRHQLLCDAERHGEATRHLVRPIHRPRQEVVRPARDEVENDDEPDDGRRER